jgi:hypothetical protein
VTKEHAIQNEIRNDQAGECLLFRANVGQAWAGKECIRLPNGDMLIKQPRPFSTGLPPGFSDLFGLKRTLVTPEMVGTYVGVFVGVETKTATGKPSEAQVRFIRAINDNGGRAGIARSTYDARKIITGET